MRPSLKALLQPERIVADGLEQVALSVRPALLAKATFSCRVVAQSVDIVQDGRLSSTELDCVGPGRDGLEVAVGVLGKDASDSLDGLGR